MEGKTSLTFVQEQQFIKTHFALSPHSPCHLFPAHHIPVTPVAPVPGTSKHQPRMHHKRNSLPIFSELLCDSTKGAQMHQV